MSISAKQAFDYGAANGMGYWKKVATKTYSDFSTAGLSNTINTGYSLPKGWSILGAVIKPTTAFAGGLISAYTISVGAGANLIKYFTSTSVFTGFTSPIQPKMNVGIESYSSDVAINVTAISVTGLLNAATAGSVDIYLFIAKIP